MQDVCIGNFPMALKMPWLVWTGDDQGRKCGGVWGGGSPPQGNDPVGLKLRAVGLKIMRLFTCSVLRSKLNIFETRDRLRLLSWKFAQTDQTAQK
jgi:hypothetical protein